MANKQNFSDVMSMSCIKRMIAMLSDGPKTLIELQDEIGATKPVMRSCIAHLVDSQAAIVFGKFNRSFIYQGTGKYFPRAVEVERRNIDGWIPVRDVMQIAFFGMGRA